MVDYTKRHLKIEIYRMPKQPAGKLMKLSFGEEPKDKSFVKSLSRHEVQVLMCNVVNKYILINDGAIMDTIMGRSQGDPYYTSMIGWRISLLPF